MSTRILHRTPLWLSIATPVLLGLALAIGPSNPALRGLQDILWYLSVGSACIASAMAAGFAIMRRRATGKWSTAYLWPIVIGFGTLLVFGLCVAIVFGQAISQFD